MNKHKTHHKPSPKTKQYQNQKIAVSHIKRTGESPEFLWLENIIMDLHTDTQKGAEPGRNTPSFTGTNIEYWCMSSELRDANGSQNTVGTSARYLPRGGSDLQQRLLLCWGEEQLTVQPCNNPALQPCKTKPKNPHQSRTWSANALISPMHAGAGWDA